MEIKGRKDWRDSNDKKGTSSKYFSNMKYLVILTFTHTAEAKREAPKIRKVQTVISNLAWSLL